jgi:hypothetical protein
MRRIGRGSSAEDASIQKTTMEAQKTANHERKKHGLASPDDRAADAGRNAAGVRDDLEGVPG